MAAEFYVTIEGTKQGALTGESTHAKHEGSLDGLAFHYSVAHPRDAGSGMATGRRIHQPISFVKEWGAASPQIFQALVTNETITSALFEFVRTDENSEEVVYHRIKVKSARVTEIEQFIDDSQVTSGRGREKISLVFQRIEVENLDGKTSAIDDFSKI
jgi:type VI secretion system secreted protein Hcp